MMDVTLIRTPSDLSAATQRWTRLHAQCCCPLPYTLPQWYETSLRTVDAGHEPFVLVFSRNSIDQALVPLVHARVRRFGVVTHQLSLVNNDYTPFQTLLRVCEADDLFSEMMAYLHRLFGWRFQLDLNELRLTEDEIAALDRLGKRGWILSRTPRSVNRYLTLQSNFAETLAQLEPKAHRELARKNRRLERQGAVRLVRIQDAEGARAHLDTFFTMYARTWKGAEPKPEFYAALCDTLAASGMLHFTALTLDSRPIAYLLSCRFGSTLYGIKTTYDPDLAALSPGVVLFYHTIQDASSIPEIREVDFGRGDEFYKREWTHVSRKTMRVSIVPQAAAWSVVHAVQTHVVPQVKAHPLGRAAMRALGRPCPEPESAAAPVVLLGMHASSLQVARSLGRRGIRVYGVSEGTETIGRHCRYVRLLKAPEGGAALRDFLIDFARQEQCQMVIVPLSDAYVVFLNEHSNSLASHFAWPRLSGGWSLGLLDKSSAARVLCEMGVAHPATVCIGSGDDIPSAIAKLTYPCCIKPDRKSSWENSPQIRSVVGAGERMLMVESAEDLFRLLPQLIPFGPVVVQEWIPGPCTNHVYYVGYRDRRSTMALSFTGAKMRTLPDCRGSETMLRSVHDAQARALGESILQRLRYHGPAGIDIKRDERTGVYTVIEVNCRIGLNDGYLAGHGMDIAWCYYRDNLGQDVAPVVSYPEGVVWCDEERDLEWMRDYRTSHGMSWVHWLVQVARADVHALFDISDPMPFAAAAASTVRRGAAKLMRRWPAARSGG